MNVVDSSGWLEYFADGPNSTFFAAPIEQFEQLIVPSLSLYEVFKRLVQQRSEQVAIQLVAIMQQAIVSDLDAATALSAAQFSREYRLPMADSIIFATAHKHRATLWTQDADFRDIEGVQYIAARPRPLN